MLGTASLDLDTNADLLEWIHSKCPQTAMNSCGAVSHIHKEHDYRHHEPTRRIRKYFCFLDARCGLVVLKPKRGQTMLVGHGASGFSDGN